jgi:DNA-binding CsgD family transcriptional regulator
VVAKLEGFLARHDTAGGLFRRPGLAQCYRILPNYTGPNSAHGSCWATVRTVILRGQGFDMMSFKQHSAVSSGDAGISRAGIVPDRKQNGGSGLASSSVRSVRESNSASVALQLLDLPLTEQFPHPAKMASFQRMQSEALDHASDTAENLCLVLGVATRLAREVRGPNGAVDIALQALLAEVVSALPTGGGSMRAGESDCRTLSHVDPHIGQPPQLKPRAPDSALSVREKSILELISRGLSNKQIAKTLNIGPETVKSHVRHVFIKLDVERRAQAVALAQNLGLIEVHGRA